MLLTLKLRFKHLITSKTGFRLFNFFQSRKYNGEMSIAFARLTNVLIQIVQQLSKFFYPQLQVGI